MDTSPTFLLLPFNSIPAQISSPPLSISMSEGLNSLRNSKDMDNRFRKILFLPFPAMKARNASTLLRFVMITAQVNLFYAMTPNYAILEFSCVKLDIVTPVFSLYAGW